MTRDFDDTHISAKSPSEWENALRKNLNYRLLRIETFYDLTAKNGNKLLFFKSVKASNFGLTIRILVRK